MTEEHGYQTSLIGIRDYIIQHKEGCSITFVEVPSQLEWNIHQEAHAFATSLLPVAAGRRPASTLDSVRKRVTESALDSWKQLFRDPDYRGHHFLELQDHKGAVLQPTYTKGGTWLHWLNRDNPLCARACRAILNHAPIGDYYCRFNIQEPFSCTCHWMRLQTRVHLFECCPCLETRRTPVYLKEFIRYLERNLSAFAFRCEPAPAGVG